MGDGGQGGGGRDMGKKGGKKGWGLVGVGRRYKKNMNLFLQEHVSLK